MVVGLTEKPASFAIASMIARVWNELRVNTSAMTCAREEDGHGFERGATDVLLGRVPR